MPRYGILTRFLFYTCVSFFGAQSALAAVAWSNFPTQVNVNAPISFTVYEASGGPTPPKVSLYRNGVLVGPAGTQSYTYNGVAPATPQTLTFYATTTYGTSSTRTLQVIGGNTAPFGSVDAIASSVTLGAILTVSGWASDAEQGSPISRVDILVDGVDIGDATLGLSRSDVSYPNAGWSYALDTGSLSLGSHSVSVRLVDNGTLTATISAGSFTVTDSGSGTGAQQRPEIMEFGLRTKWDGVGRISMGVNSLGSPAGATTPYVFRAIGPAMEDWAFGPVYQDPEVVVVDVGNGGVEITRNDDWADRNRDGVADSPTDPARLELLYRVSQTAMVDFPATPTGDCAVAFDAPSSLIQFKVDGPDMPTKGELIVEFVNADSTTDVDVFGLSLRKKFYNGEVDRYSFSLPLGPPVWVLMRARGPNLAPLVGGMPVLTDPVMGLFSGADQIKHNDNWGQTVSSGYIPAVTPSEKWVIENGASLLGLYPLSAGSKDAAIAVKLDPGDYEIKVWGGLVGDQTNGECILDLFVFDDSLLY